MISNKFLFEGEQYDFEEIKRRTLEDGCLRMALEGLR